MRISKSLMNYATFLFVLVGLNNASAVVSNTEVTKFSTTTDYSIEVHVRELANNQYLQGTAFAVTDEGDFITAQHVVSGCANTFVKYNNEWIKADYVKKHKNSDVALVHIPEKTHPIRITLEEGQPQVALMVGFPASQNHKFFEKQINYVVTTNFKVIGLFTVKTAADVWEVQDNDQKKNHIKGKYEGMSGGPVLDEEGYVAGVIVAENATEPLTVTMLPNDILDMLDNRQLINNQRSKDVAIGKNDMLRNSSITQIMCKN